VGAIRRYRRVRLFKEIDNAGIVGVILRSCLKRVSYFTQKSS
jgi:hypothetical protein